MRPGLTAGIWRLAVGRCSCAQTYQGREGARAVTVRPSPVPFPSAPPALANVGHFHSHFKSSTLPGRLLVPRCESGQRSGRPALPAPACLSCVPGPSRQRPGESARRPGKPVLQDGLMKHSPEAGRKTNADCPQNQPLAGRAHPDCLFPLAWPARPEPRPRISCVWVSAKHAGVGAGAP